MKSAAVLRHPIATDEILFEFGSEEDEALPRNESFFFI